MARIRTVKPELLRHEGLYELEQQTGLPVRLGFIGLLTSCDREGRFKWRPRVLKLDALPFDDLDFSRVLDALESRGFVVKYKVGTEIYGYIPTFLVHQSINNKEAQSVLPSPDEARVIIHNNQELIKDGSRVTDASSTREPPDDHATLEHSRGREGKGREGEDRGNTDDTPKRTRFKPPTLEEVADYCMERKNTVDPMNFIDHYEANGWKVGKNPMKDWKAAVRTWERSRWPETNSTASPQRPLRPLLNGEE